MREKHCLPLVGIDEQNPELDGALQHAGVCDSV